MERCRPGDGSRSMYCCGCAQFCYCPARCEALRSWEWPAEYALPQLCPILVVSRMLCAQLGPELRVCVPLIYGYKHFYTCICVLCVCVSRMHVHIYNACTLWSSAGLGMARRVCTAAAVPTLAIVPQAVERRSLGHASQSVYCCGSVQCDYMPLRMPLTNRRTYVHNVMEYAERGTVATVRPATNV